jgi:hypothetical protein
VDVSDLLDVNIAALVLRLAFKEFLMTCQKMDFYIYLSGTIYRGRAS